MSTSPINLLLCSTSPALAPLEDCFNQRIATKDNQHNYRCLTFKQEAQVVYSDDIDTNNAFREIINKLPKIRTEKNLQIVFFGSRKALHLVEGSSSYQALIELLTILFPVQSEQVIKSEQPTTSEHQELNSLLPIYFLFPGTSSRDYFKEIIQTLVSHPLLDSWLENFVLANSENSGFQAAIEENLPLIINHYLANSASLANNINCQNTNNSIDSINLNNGGNSSNNGNNLKPSTSLNHTNYIRNLDLSLLISTSLTSNIQQEALAYKVTTQLKEKLPPLAIIVSIQRITNYYTIPPYNFEFYQEVLQKLNTNSPALNLQININNTNTANNNTELSSVNIWCFSERRPLLALLKHPNFKFNPQDYFIIPHNQGAEQELQSLLTNEQLTHIYKVKGITVENYLEAIGSIIAASSLC